MVKAASQEMAKLGEVVTYTIAIREHAAPPTTTLYVSDHVPAGLLYVPGSLAATTGLVTDTAAPDLRWSGSLSPTGAATVTYAVTVSTWEPGQITNRAIVSATGFETATASEVITILHPMGLPRLDSSSKTVSAARADYGERVTYTVEVVNAGGPLTDVLTMTDTIPPELSYVPGTLTATRGLVDDTDAPTLTWSGVLSPTPYATIQYEARVEITAARRVENMALISAASRRYSRGVIVFPTFPFRASLIVNGIQAYLPNITRSQP